MAMMSHWRAPMGERSMSSRMSMKVFLLMERFRCKLVNRSVYVH